MIEKKQCAVCGHEFSGGALQCPKCGCGVFQTPNKKHLDLIQKTALPEGFFDAPVPAGSVGYCSDNNCPCDPSTVIPKGGGYLYIAPEIVKFRSLYPRMDDASTVSTDVLERCGIVYDYKIVSGKREMQYIHIGPVLVCQEGARLRKLNMDVAAKDAKLWWNTGLVPLRATPIDGALKGFFKKIFK